MNFVYNVFYNVKESETDCDENMQEQNFFLCNTKSGYVKFLPKLPVKYFPSIRFHLHLVFLNVKTYIQST